jgi:hypothetical protein
MGLCCLREEGSKCNGDGEEEDEGEDHGEDRGPVGVLCHWRARRVVMGRFIVHASCNSTFPISRGPVGVL